MEAQTILLVVVTMGRTTLIDCWPLWVTIIAALTAKRFVHYLYALPPLVPAVAVAAAIETPADEAEAA